ncbi:MAG: hypothetical protein GY938_24370 [Ketobacter sp.]|nr:hypothetical protein [Ketobacter sp.]
MQTDDKKIRYIVDLTAGYSKLSNDALKSYLSAVAEFSPDVVEMAVSLFLRSLVEGYSPKYKVKPPELAAECRKIISQQQRNEYMASHKASTQAAAKVEISPEEKSRVTMKFLDLQKTLGTPVSLTAKFRSQYEQSLQHGSRPKPSCNDVHSHAGQSRHTTVQGRLYR